MKIHLTAIALFILSASCSSNCSDDTNRQNIIKSDNSESLEFWTADIILATNYPLVQLMDTLYQYVRSDSFPTESLESEIEWMRNYRKQLISYYDSKHKYADDISPLTKADSVISEAHSLWNIDRDYSTMGLIIYNDTERTRLIFQQFNEYERLLSICKTDIQKNLLYNELVQWVKLEQIFSHINSFCVDLYHWGGSIAGPIRTSGYISIWQSHIDLYQTEYIMLASYDGAWEDTGTFLEPARELLLSCSKQALAESYYPSETSEMYKDMYKKTTELLEQLPQYIDSWIDARKQWEDEVSTDFMHQSYSRNTSSVLIKLANTISSLQ